MIQEYWYNEQLRAYILQFCGVFSGLKTLTGLGADGKRTLISVPVLVGNKDRVVAAIQAGNTQNRPFSLPAMSAWMQGLDLAPERRKGVGVVDRKVYLPSGGVFPDDLKIATRVMPIPYNANFELSIYASNTDQMYQILEQLLILFDPILQIQTTDAPFDWTKITTIELTNISNEENFPIGGDKRITVWTLGFTMPIYLSAPMDLKENIVHEINIRLGDLSGFNLEEIDSDGTVQPFTEVYGPVIRVSGS